MLDANIGNLTVIFLVVLCVVLVVSRLRMFILESGCFCGLLFVIVMFGLFCLCLCS